MIREFCDHCNKEIIEESEDDTIWNVINDTIWNVINDMGYMPDETLLCKECSDKLSKIIRNFIDGEEV